MTQMDHGEQRDATRPSLGTRGARYREIVATLSRHGLGSLAGRFDPRGPVETAPEHVRLALEELGPFVNRIRGIKISDLAALDHAGIDRRTVVRRDEALEMIGLAAGIAEFQSVASRRRHPAPHLAVERADPGLAPPERQPPCTAPSPAARPSRVRVDTLALAA